MVVSFLINYIIVNCLTLDYNGIFVNCATDNANYRALAYSLEFLEIGDSNNFVMIKSIITKDGFSSNKSIRTK